MKSFSTTDVYLTAALAASGWRPDSTTLADTRLTFHWSASSDAVRTVAEKYYNKSLVVDARTMAEEIKSVKTLCHNPM